VDYPNKSYLAPQHFRQGKIIIANLVEIRQINKGKGNEELCYLNIPVLSLKSVIVLNGIDYYIVYTYRTIKEEILTEKYMVHILSIDFIYIIIDLLEPNRIVY